MPRYVILEHDHPMLHWDFMLEVGSALRTWRLANRPGDQTAIQATALGDHRLIYLDYEGAVSGNRGSVKRWDAGVYAMIEQRDELWLVRLRGKQLRGTARLQSSDSGWGWSFAPDVSGDG